MLKVHVNFIYAFEYSMVDSRTIFTTLRVAQWQFDLAYRISPKSAQKYGDCERLHVVSYVKCDCH